MRVNCKQLYTESIGCHIASDSASYKSSQSQIHANQYVFLPHYPDSLVNYPFAPLTANSDIRITTRIGSLERIKNESRKPNESGTNREMRTNHERIRKTERIMNCDIFATDPSSGNKEYPLQWKLRVDPHSGNMVLIR
jgi:hypothetical protein